MLLLALLPSASAGHVRALVQHDDQGLRLLDLVHIEGPARASQVDAAGELRVLDAEGALLGLAQVPDFRRRSVVHEASGGELAELASAAGWVELEWPAGASWVELDGQRLQPRVPPPATGVAVQLSGDSEQRLDMVFLGDGYDSSEQQLFADDVDRMTAYLLSIEPYGAYTGLFNVWRVDAVSTDSGVDHPSTNTYRDTAYGCYYDCAGISRLICCEDQPVMAAVNDAVPGADGILVLINDPQYGGSGGFNYATSYTDGRTGEQVAAHELGHSLVGLWDEYSYGTDYSGQGPNCARDGDDPPWSHWMDEPGVGAFQPCSYTSLHRPTEYDCMMNSLQDDYCPVCREQAVLAIYAQIPELVLSALPSEDQTVSVDGATSFELELVGELEVLWSLDEVEVGQGGTLQLPGCEEGTHSLKAQVWDPTSWVRDDPQGLLQDEVTWTLECTGRVDSPAGDSGSPDRPRRESGQGCACSASPSPASIGLFAAILVAVAARRRLN